MIFQHAPAVLHRIVLAVIGRIVHQLNRHLDFVRKFDYSFNKLRSVTLEFRAIVQIDLQSFNVRKMVFSVTPPVLQ